MAVKACGVGERWWRRIGGQLLVIAAALTGVWVWGCVADTGEGEPSIGVVDVICSESFSADYDGQVVSRIEAPVVDAEDDLVRVTATVQGVDLSMEEEEEGIFVYTQDLDSDTFIRCEEGLKVVIRATDEAGNVAERNVVVSN